MPKKQLKFLEKARSIHGNIYDYSLVNYVSSDVHVIIVCSIHGQFNQAPNSHINKKIGCPTCGYITRSSNNILKYGVSNPAKLHSTREKTNQTRMERYGVNNYTNREKAKHTCLLRYGHENIAHGTAAKIKIETTNLEKYGGHPRKNKEVQDKQKATNLERYGDTNPIKNIQIQQKVRQTKLQKHGESWYNNREKYRQTVLEKYGGHPAQLHLLDILPLITEYDWLFDQYVVQGKTATQIADELGCVWYGTIISYLRKAEIEILHHIKVSYMCRRWLNQIENINHIIIIPEFRFDLTRKRADGYCEVTNTIYEFHGDFWHGNPTVYAPEVINAVTGTTMGELYKKTMDRENKIKELGYNLIVMWESDYDM